MRKIFSHEILKKEVPTLPQCTQALIEHKSLRSRTPKQIQLWVLSETKRTDAAAQGNYGIQNLEQVYIGQEVGNIHLTTLQGF